MPKALSTNNLFLSQVKPWLGLIMVSAIALTITEFTAHLEVNYIEIALAIGIVLGIIAEGKLGNSLIGDRDRFGNYFCCLKHFACLS